MPIYLPPPPLRGPPPHAIAWGGIPPRLSGTPPFIANAIGGELCPFLRRVSPAVSFVPILSDIPLLYERRGGPPKVVG